VYPDAGTFCGTVTVADEHRSEANVRLSRAGSDKAEGTAHVILAVEDQPSLTAYRRVILELDGRE
jgi:Cellulose-binding protein Sde0182, C-terminal domain